MEASRLEIFAWSSCAFTHNRMAKMSDPMGRTPMEIDTGIASVFGSVEFSKVAWIRTPVQSRKAWGRNEPIMKYGPPAKAELASYLSPVSAVGDGSYAMFMTARNTLRRTRDWRVDPEQPLGCVGQIGAYIPSSITTAQPATGGEKAAKKAQEQKAQVIEKAKDQMSREGKKTLRQGNGDERRKPLKSRLIGSTNFWQDEHVWTAGVDGAATSNGRRVGAPERGVPSRRADGA